MIPRFAKLHATIWLIVLVPLSSLAMGIVMWWLAAAVPVVVSEPGAAPLTKTSWQERE